jgi:hypothetical protein
MNFKKKYYRVLRLLYMYHIFLWAIIISITATYSQKDLIIISLVNLVYTFGFLMWRLVKKYIYLTKLERILNG